jgi:predicted XRE-type DNA-binding protein
MNTARRISGKRGTIRVHAGSGNVFADIGVAEPEVALAKAELARQIERIIRSRRLTQAEAAEILGVDQGKVSALVRGRVSGFSTDRLFRFLAALGSNIDIVVRPRRRSDRGGYVTVLSTA